MYAIIISYRIVSFRIVSFRFSSSSSSSYSFLFFPSFFVCSPRPLPLSSFDALEECHTAHSADTARRSQISQKKKKKPKEVVKRLRRREENERRRPGRADGQNGGLTAAVAVAVAVHPNWKRGRGREWDGGDAPFHKRPSSSTTDGAANWPPPSPSPLFPPLVSPSVRPAKRSGSAFANANVAGKLETGERVSKRRLLA